MGFTLSDSHVDEYHTLGFTVFRAILPPALIADLRRETDRGRELARRKHGLQAQRFQPISAFDLDEGPFRDFRELPELNAAVQGVLTERHSYGDTTQMGVLIEPADMPWCTRWHRDYRDNAPYLDIREWDAVFLDVRHLNQSNCALFEDHSLWVVPGSHLRRDLPAEKELFPTRPIRDPELAGSSEERERAALEYCRRMPRAFQVHLDAGDYCLYRSSLWHLGCYVPYCRRATLHDFVDSPEYADFRRRMSADMERRKTEGRPQWEWSLAGAAALAR